MITHDNGDQTVSGGDVVDTLNMQKAVEKKSIGNTPRRLKEYVFARSNCGLAFKDLL